MWCDVLCPLGCEHGTLIQWHAFSVSHTCLFSPVSPLSRCESRLVRHFTWGKTIKMASEVGNWDPPPKEPKYKISPGMRLFWCGFLSSLVAFFSMFIAFCSPYWYQSWRRVHSPLANVGLWHICLSGYIKPREETLQSYVGCWWIHSSFFSDVQEFIMPRKCSTTIH